MSLIEVYCLNKYQSLYGITMKKTFDLTQQKLPMPRAIEAIKYEVKKYLKRERNNYLKVLIFGILIAGSVLMRPVVKLFIYLPLINAFLRQK